MRMAYVHGYSGVMGPVLLGVFITSYALRRTLYSILMLILLRHTPMLRRASNVLSSTFELEINTSLTPCV